MEFLDYWIAITQTKDNVASVDRYVPYNLNKSLSAFWDYIHYVNDMNHLSHLDNKLQFDYFINTLEGYTGKEKRYVQKWLETDVVENLELLKEYYNYGSVKAKEALELLTEDQLLYMKHKLRKGGLKDE